MTTTFTIPGRLPSLNEVIDANRTNPRVGARLKRESEERIGWCVKAAKVLPVSGPQLVSIDWCEQTRRRDPDNVFSAVKFILDALVRLGILADDGQAEIAGITHRLINDPDDPRIVVTLSDFDGDRP